jgi:6,7-dimethyl-8-ribityllumazine synthase
MSIHAPEPANLSASGMRIVIVAARFNAHWVDTLVERCVETLVLRGAAADDVRVVRVPGSHEVPFAVSRAISSRTTGARPDAVVALGVLLKGATNHHELVAEAVARSLLDVSLRADVPVINGVMAVDTEQQAEDRCRGEINRGVEFAHAAIEMAWLARNL